MKFGLFLSVWAYFSRSSAPPNSTEPNYGIPSLLDRFAFQWGTCMGRFGVRANGQDGSSGSRAPGSGARRQTENSGRGHQKLGWMDGSHGKRLGKQQSGRVTRASIWCSCVFFIANVSSDLQIFGFATSIASWVRFGYLITCGWVVCLPRLPAG